MLRALLIVTSTPVKGIPLQWLCCCQTGRPSKWDNDSVTPPKTSLPESTIKDWVQRTFAPMIDKVGKNGVKVIVQSGDDGRGSFSCTALCHLITLTRPDLLEVVNFILVNSNGDEASLCVDNHADGEELIKFLGSSPGISLSARMCVSSGDLFHNLVLFYESEQGQAHSLGKLAIECGPMVRRIKRVEDTSSMMHTICPRYPVSRYEAGITLSSLIGYEQQLVGVLQTCFGILLRFCEEGAQTTLCVPNIRIDSSVYDFLTLLSSIQAPYAGVAFAFLDKRMGTTATATVVFFTRVDAEETHRLVEGSLYSASWASRGTLFQQLFDFYSGHLGRLMAQGLLSGDCGPVVWGEAVDPMSAQRMVVFNPAPALAVFGRCDFPAWSEPIAHHTQPGYERPFFPRWRRNHFRWQKPIQSNVHEPIPVDPDSGEHEVSSVPAPCVDQRDPFLSEWINVAFKEVLAKGKFEVKVSKLPAYVTLDSLKLHLRLHKQAILPLSLWLSSPPMQLTAVFETEEDCRALALRLSKTIVDGNRVKTAVERTHTPDIFKRIFESYFSSIEAKFQPRLSDTDFAESPSPPKRLRSDPSPKGQEVEAGSDSREAKIEAWVQEVFGEQLQKESRKKTSVVLSGLHPSATLLSLISVMKIRDISLAGLNFAFVTASTTEGLVGILNFESHLQAWRFQAAIRAHPDLNVAPQWSVTQGLDAQLMAFYCGPGGTLHAAGTLPIERGPAAHEVEESAPCWSFPTLPMHLADLNILSMCKEKAFPTCPMPEPEESEASILAGCGVLAPSLHTGLAAPCEEKKEPMAEDRGPSKKKIKYLRVACKSIVYRAILVALANIEADSDSLSPSPSGEGSASSTHAPSSESVERANVVRRWMAGHVLLKVLLGRKADSEPSTLCVFGNIPSVLLRLAWSAPSSLSELSMASQKTWDSPCILHFDSALSARAAKDVLATHAEWSLVQGLAANLESWYCSSETDPSHVLLLSEEKGSGYLVRGPVLPSTFKEPGDVLVYSA